MTQRLICHHRAKVRTADADIDDVADWSARVPRPATVANIIGKPGHAIEHGVHSRHHILTVDDHTRTLGCPERCVQDSAVLGHVDLPAGEHCLDAFGEAPLDGKLEQ
jgi:hypothetical protein